MSRVLIVEDDLIISRIYQGLMLKQGYQTMVAGDGERALEVMQETPPNLVLLDLMLPRKSGIEVLKVMRSDPVLQEVPVLVVSNACMGELLEEATQAGATRCLVKAQTPPKQLVEVVRHYLNPEPARAIG